MNVRKMDYETALKTCSEEVQAAIKWLEEHVKFGKETLECKLEEEKDREWVKEDISRRLAAKYLCSDAIVFYVLSKVKSPLLKDFFEAAKSDEFWLSEDENEIDAKLYDYPPLLYYLAKMGLNSNEYFEEAVNMAVKNQQTVKGEIGSDFYHTGPMRDLIAIEPNSEATDMAVRYFLSDLEWFKKSYHQAEIALGVLALYELDSSKFKEIIEELANYLKNTQKNEGYWERYFDREHVPIAETAYVTKALSRVFGAKDESVIKAIEWLKSNQEEDGSWKNSWDGASGQSDDYWKNYWAYPVNTAYACLALMGVGEGPKIPLEEVEWKKMLTKQKLERTKPTFVQTSPNLGVMEIKEKIQEMLNSANERIWICSRFITEFWTDIIKLKQEKPQLDVRIVTHPVTGKNKARYEGDGKKFVVPAFDALQRLLGKNFRTQPLLHARLYVVDDEVLIASADITSEQLEKEFNAGIWTRDKETVEEAVIFFENLWKESEGKTT